MKRSIRAAAVLCAVAVALSVLLAGCGNEDEPNGNGSNGLGGHVGENRFKGLTITYDDEWTETYAFTSDTKGEFSDEDFEAFPPVEFEYAVDDTKGLLKVRIATYMSAEDASGWESPKVTVVPLDDYIAESYGNLDKDTKSLIYDAMANRYRHYEFSADGTTVTLTRYYSGNMAESDAEFEYYDSEHSIGLEFGRSMYLNVRRGNERHYYEGYPKFAGNGSFTAVIFEETYDRGTDTDTYTKLSTSLAGTYQINGTGTKCTGTVTFTQLPDELKSKDGVGFELNEPYTVKSDWENRMVYTITKK